MKEIDSIRQVSRDTFSFCQGSAHNTLEVLNFVRSIENLNVANVTVVNSIYIEK